MSEQQFVVVGGSLTGAKAVETLREEGFGGRIVLVGEETELPYERPPLSKGVLAGKEDASVAFPHDRQWYADQQVQLLLGSTATGLDTDAHQVTLADGSTLDYDRLLIATGSRVRRLPIPGGDLPGVHYLRSMDDSLRLRDELARRPRVVVVGAGWIGLETASAARAHGAEVTVVEPQPTPLYAVLGPEVGEIFASIHRAQGVDFRFGDGVREFRGDGSVSSVVTSSGAELPADLVIVGVGIAPATALAEAGGLEVDNGIVCDQTLATSAADVYAAGDVANWYNPLLGYRLRVEHWANAHDGGQAAARSMLDQDVVYDVVPFFFSDQYDLGMEYAGHVRPGASPKVVLRGDVPNEFMAFWVVGDLLVAGMHVNVWDTMDPVQEVIRSSRPVDPAKLADASVPLGEVYAS